MICGGLSTTMMSFHFNWETICATSETGMTTRAAEDDRGGLIMRIIESLLAPQEHDGDVMDLHFIAHSRGVVVVTEALRVLTAQDNPLIKRSFIALTLLDPHPANNKYHPGSDTIGEFASGDLFFYDYKAFQDKALDPQVQIPASRAIRSID